jgi:dolichol-phosphate mannosyltransferase
MRSLGYILRSPTSRGKSGRPSWGKSPRSNFSCPFAKIASKKDSNSIMISVILPTYNESENLKVIIPNLSDVFINNNITGEIIVIDDNSTDGTPDVATELAKKYPVKVFVRKNERGIATAVMKGFELATEDLVVVMDADLSHPIEKIPDMIKPILENRCDATVGTRYITRGGSKKWHLIREIISKGAGFLAKGVTTLSDPTSGFMAIRKNMLERATLDPIGWKIVLEIIVKANPRLIEVPIIFTNRLNGKSKLTLKVYLEYLRHLWRLYIYKYPTVYQFFKFCLVGLSGLIIDTIILMTLVEHLSFDPRFASIFAFSGALSWNYLFNKIWTFKESDLVNIGYSYFSFAAICLVGLGIRIGTMHILITKAGMGQGRWYIVASIIGILLATISNFLGSKYLAFSNNIFAKKRFLNNC